MWQQNKARHNDPWYNECYFGPILLEGNRKEVAHKRRIQTEKPELWWTSLYMFHFFVTEKLADKQEIILYQTWRDKNWLLLCCSWDLICLPLTCINGWEEATQKNTYGCIKKWTSANKRCTTCTELWQLIKAHALNVAVINYAEGSIVCFCRLRLQIIERFKDVVGGGSCRLSFFFFFVWLLYLLHLWHGCVWLFGARLLSSPLPVHYFVHFSFSNQAIKTANACQSKHKPRSCQQLALSILAFVAPICSDLIQPVLRAKAA